MKPVFKTFNSLSNASFFASFFAWETFLNLSIRLKVFVSNFSPFYLFLSGLGREADEAEAKILFFLFPRVCREKKLLNVAMSQPCRSHVAAMSQQLELRI